MLTIELHPTKACQKYAINAEIHPNLSRQSVSLLSGLLPSVCGKASFSVVVPSLHSTCPVCPIILWPLLRSAPLAPVLSHKTPQKSQGPWRARCEGGREGRRTSSCRSSSQWPTKSTGLDYKAVPRLGQLCSCCCLPILPQLACSILATWGRPYTVPLYTGVKELPMFQDSNRS